jgi:hypothetical protein
LVKVSVRIDEIQKRKLAEESRWSGRKESDIVRAALESYFAAYTGKETYLNVARWLGVDGHAKGLAPDLSTNKDHSRSDGGSIRPVPRSAFCLRRPACARRVPSRVSVHGPMLSPGAGADRTVA